MYIVWTFSDCADVFSVPLNPVIPLNFVISSKLCKSSRNFKNKLWAKYLVLSFYLFGLSMLLSCNASDYLFTFTFFDSCILYLHNTIIHRFYPQNICIGIVLDFP